MEYHFLDLLGLSFFMNNLTSVFATKKTVIGATTTENGESGLVPAPTIGDQKKCLMGDGTYGYPDMVSISSDATYEALEEE